MSSSDRKKQSDAPPRPGARSNAKRAAKLADGIVGDVIAIGWPVGDVLGSETALLERYEVSRAVFREAVRLVEHQQVARTRRGPGGGLVITEPTVDAVISAVVLYLYRLDARLDEVFEARIALEEIACALAAGRVDDGALARLQPFIVGDPNHGSDPRALHALVASISRNPALELFVDVLNRVAQLYSADWRAFGPAVGAETSHAHSRIAAAVSAGNAALAGRRMRTHLEAEADYLRRRRSTRQVLPDEVVLGASPHAKRAEAVARSITLLVIEEGMQPGQLIGTEAELIQRAGVSRAVLREAVRLLEHHQIARMRRGPGGGFFVVEPSAAAVTEIAAIYLARRGMRLTDLAELRTGVEIAIVGLAAERIDDHGRQRLRRALVREETSSDAERSEAVHDLHAAVAGAAHNRVLELVALVLIRLSRLYQIERLAPRAQREIRAEVYRAHAGIAAAVESGDAEQAKHRMRRHLDALGAVMR